MRGTGTVRTLWRRGAMLAGVSLTVAATAIGSTAMGSTVARPSHLVGPAGPAGTAGPAGSARPDIIPTASALDGVFCTSSDNFWAAGAPEISSFAQVNLVQHW